MSSEIKEIIEDGEDNKKIKRLPVPFSAPSRRLLEHLQDLYKVKHRRKITRADLAGKIFEKLRKLGVIESTEL